MAWAVLLGASSASAGGLEIAIHGGRVAPFYEQTFTYGPGQVPPLIPGVTIRQEGAFTIRADGRTAYGGSVTAWATGALGIEGRIDVLDVDPAVTSSRFSVHADFPAPFPDFDTEIDLEPGTVQLEPIRPVSLNLKLKTPDPVSLTLSGGITYLSGSALTVVVPVGLGATGLSGSDLQVATIELKAQARPESGDDDARLGLNAGLGLRLALGKNVGLFAEGRYFVFEKHQLTWSRASDRPLSAREQQLFEALLSRLDTVEFTPQAFQGVVGLSLRF